MTEKSEGTGIRMMRMFSMPLELDEEKIAQLLTRDAWSYFSSPTELPNRVPVRAIPFMPRKGHFELPDEPLVITYYLTFAGTYFDELSHLGWTGARYHDACEGFLTKVERATGVLRRAPAPDMRATP
jgi:hypothetical protein